MANNESKSNVSAGGGVSILTVLQIIFIVLKCAKIGDFAKWSWVKVLIPTWIGLGIFLIAVVILLIVAIVAVIKRRKY